MTCVNDQEMIRMAFRVLDSNGDGRVESSSFKHLMTKIGIEDISCIYLRSLKVIFRLIYFRLWEHISRREEID